MGNIIHGRFGRKNSGRSVKKPLSPGNKAPILQFNFRHNAFVRDRAARTYEWTHRVEKYGLRADTDFHTTLLYRLEPSTIDETVAALRNLPPRLFDWKKLSEDQRFASVVGACVISSTSISDFVQRLKRYQSRVLTIITIIRKDGMNALRKNPKLYQRAIRIIRDVQGVGQHD